jgi:asparagine synthase (glutamine-hydrolysing)
VLGIHIISVGLPDGSASLAAAQIVANHIGTIHHEIKFTIQEGCY